MKVSNLEGQNGKKVANQIIIETDLGVYFKSYDSIIAFTPDDKLIIFLDEKFWNYSATTIKYRNQFLKMTSKQVDEYIKSGLIKLVNLNAE
jgi:hypothetical protein